MRRTIRIIIAVVLLTMVIALAVTRFYGVYTRLGYAEVVILPEGMGFAWWWGDSEWYAVVHFEGASNVRWSIVPHAARNLLVANIMFHWPLLGLAFLLTCVPAWLLTRPRKAARAFPVEVT